MQHKNSNPINKIIAKIFITRFLVDFFLRNLFFFFGNCSSKQTASWSIIAFSSESTNYWPQDFKPEAISFILSILLVHACYTANAMATSFLCGSYGRP